MIAAETETIYARQLDTDYYDNFLFFGKKKGKKAKKELSNEERQARKNKRRETANKIGSTALENKDLIIGALGNRIGNRGNNTPISNPEYDYEFNYGRTPEQDNEETSFPTGIVVVVGLLGLAALGVWAFKNNQNKVLAANK